MGPDRTGTGLTESAACVVLAQDAVHHKPGIPPLGTQPARTSSICGQHTQGSRLSRNVHGVDSCLNM
jgi:hypothetical protein